MFSDAFSRDTQLFCGEPKAHTYLACALVARGKDIQVSTLRQSIDK
jgi:hypothetical protein